MKILFAPSCAEPVGSTWVWDMQLNDHDLKQLDEERVRSLTVESLCILSLKLLADLKEARDRLNQSPENSLTMGIPIGSFSTTRGCP
jgi:hypothetical protein